MKNLLIFMLPILVSYVFQQLYNAVDTAYGEGDERKLRKSVAGSLVIGAGTIAVMTVLSLLGLGPLLRLLGTPEAIYAEALSYIRIIGGWIVVMFAYNLLSSLLRAIGDSAMSLVFLVISSVPQLS